MLIELAGLFYKNRGTVLFVDATSVIDSRNINEMFFKIQLKNNSEFTFSYHVKALPVALEFFHIHGKRLAFHCL